MVLSKDAAFRMKLIGTKILGKYWMKRLGCTSVQAREKMYGLDNCINIGAPERREED